MGVDVRYNQSPSGASLRVLVAEDDAGLRSVLERGLRENGYVVDAVADGKAAGLYLRSYEYDVVVLDWRMPGMTGVEVITEARRLGLHVPVLMLTARDTTSDRISGLNSGADDYLVKPFDFGELLARLHALQRRPSVSIGPELECGDLVFDPGPAGPKSVGTRSLSPSQRWACSRSFCDVPRRWSPAERWRYMYGMTKPTQSAPIPSTSTWGGCGPNSGEVGSRSRRSGAPATGWWQRERIPPSLEESGSRRFHATRVAIVATAAVMVCYLLGVVALNLVVVNRLTGQADVRLAQRLAEARSSASSVTLTPVPPDADHDIDDAPRFVWIVDPKGQATALTPGAPRLNNRTWSTGASTMEINGTDFRIQTVRSGDGWMVAGESLAQLERVQSALIGPSSSSGLFCWWPRS